MLENILPGTGTKLRIVRTIYEKQGININSLIKKVRASPNSVLNYVNKLCAFGLIKEEILSGEKKIHMRILKPNFDNDFSKIFYSLVETDKKLLFFEKYKKLKPHFVQLGDIINKNIEFVLVFGSYARFAATKDSDLDILIVGKIDRKKIQRIREIFITMGPEPSIKFETFKSFLKNRKKPLYQNILKEHVILFGELNFMKILK